ncbi:unnamed protein product [Durusdinium trenchii]|uniref:Ion transport domain-containing protein n=2 Tax=Durusdinium trenchii TaxID=1381693 RepID=A0ABP0IVR1_9DINO
MAASSFHHYLQALNSEFERLLLENKELRKELQNEPMWLLKSLEMDEPKEAKGEEGRRSTGEGTPTAEVTKSRSTDRFGVQGVRSTVSSQLRLSGHSTGSALAPPSVTAPSLAPPLPGAVEDEPKKHTVEATWVSEVPGGVGAPEGPPPSLNGKGRNLRDLRTPSGSAEERKVVDYESEETEENANFLLLLDIIPAIVILASTAVAGISADNDPDGIAWTVLEAIFTLFFLGELIVRMTFFGVREFLFGSDWYWSWFDILCVVLALIDMGIVYTTLGSGGQADTGPVSALKMLKLARLGRIIRLLKFKIFQELKLMIQGVFTGLRVLFWAVVLLVGCMYLLGVVTKVLFGDFRIEFSTVPAAMFTNFRCFTDGCTSIEGEPLQDKLREEYGGLFLVGYILTFLFVTIGMFNLIMAVFIDNVTDGSTKKRQRELGANAPRTAWVLSSVLRDLILSQMLRREAEDEAAAEEELLQREMSGEHTPRPSGARRSSKIYKEKLLALQERYGYKPHTVQEYDELTQQIRKEMANTNVQVSRAEFNHWLSTERELLETLNDAEIDLSCKSDLFDVLDADLSGVLEFEEMIDGLLKCRGPASKTDIIAIRLKTSHLVQLVTRLCAKLDVPTGDPFAEDEC